MNKFVTIALPTIMLLFSMISCTKETAEKKDEWVEIDSVMPNLELSHILDSIFEDSWMEKECLHIKYPKVVYIVNSMEEYEQIDTCNSIPYINFDRYTLTIGGFSVANDQNKITNIKLLANDYQASYNYEISLDTCDWCWAVAGEKYFWRLFPKLNPKYKLDANIKNVK